MHNARKTRRAGTSAFTVASGGEAYTAAKTSPAYTARPVVTAKAPAGPCTCEWCERAGNTGPVCVIEQE
jgi:hypothetical protein